MLYTDKPTIMSRRIGLRRVGEAELGPVSSHRPSSRNTTAICIAMTSVWTGTSPLPPRSRRVIEPSNPWQGEPSISLFPN
ncbi:MAG TPA: hypothetical protein VFG12_09880 [Rhodopila sp.]|nr:hypothetical protein [Rhodopila sp.]